jgi:hypothetical protein
LAAALVLLGRFDEAHAAVKAGLALNPIYTVSRVGAAWTAMSDDPTLNALSRPSAGPEFPSNDRRPLARSDPLLRR